MNFDQQRVDRARTLIEESLAFLGQANELIYRVSQENIEAANESLCRAITELKGCLKAL